MEQRRNRQIATRRRGPTSASPLSGPSSSNTLGNTPTSKLGNPVATAIAPQTHQRVTATGTPQGTPRRLSPHAKPNSSHNFPGQSRPQVYHTNLPDDDFDEFNPKPDYNPLASMSSPRQPSAPKNAGSSVLLYQSQTQSQSPSPPGPARSPHYPQPSHTQGSTQRPAYQPGATAPQAQPRTGIPQGHAQGQINVHGYGNAQPSPSGYGHTRTQSLAQGYPQGQTQGQSRVQGQGQLRHQSPNLARSFSQNETSSRHAVRAPMPTSPRSHTMSPENVNSTQPSRPMKVVYDYHAQTSSELSVKAGQRVEYLDQNASWALVMLPDGRQGWVPKGYLSPG